MKIHCHCPSILQQLRASPTRTRPDQEGPRIAGSNRQVLVLTYAASNALLVISYADGLGSLAEEIHRYDALPVAVRTRRIQEKVSGALPSWNSARPRRNGCGLWRTCGPALGPSADKVAAGEPHYDGPPGVIGRRNGSRD